MYWLTYSRYLSRTENLFSIFSFGSIILHKILLSLNALNTSLGPIEDRRRRSPSHFVLLLLLHQKSIHILNRSEQQEQWATTATITIIRPTNKNETARTNVVNTKRGDFVRSSFYSNSLEFGSHRAGGRERERERKTTTDDETEMEKIFEEKTKNRIDATQWWRRTPKPVGTNNAKCVRMKNSISHCVRERERETEKRSKIAQNHFSSLSNRVDERVNRRWATQDAKKEEKTKREKNQISRMLCANTKFNNRNCINSYYWMMPTAAQRETREKRSRVRSQPSPDIYWLIGIRLKIWIDDACELCPAPSHPRAHINRNHIQVRYYIGYWCCSLTQLTQTNVGNSHAFSIF